MKIRTFALTTAAALFVAGSAFAQSSGGTGTGSSSGQGAGQNGPTSTMGTGANSDKGAGTSSMTTGSTSNSMYKSDEEKMMYQKNAGMMRPFFKDDSMSELKSESEIKSTYQGLDAQSQASLKKTCDAAEGKRGSYGTTTMTLCSSIGTM